jgi:hypothetical protein
VSTVGGHQLQGATRQVKLKRARRGHGADEPDDLCQPRHVAPELPWPHGGPFADAVQYVQAHLAEHRGQWQLVALIVAQGKPRLDYTHYIGAHKVILPAAPSGNNRRIVGS